MALDNVVKRTGKWATAPLRTDLEGLVSKAAEKPEVKAVLSARPESRDSLRDSLVSAYTHNRGLRRLAGYLDTANRVTVPIDATLAYFDIMGGVGVAGETLMTALRLPGYLAYDAYYALKTGDVIGALGNLAYEGISWLVPGSLPHLIGIYAAQSERQIVNEGAKKFLKADKAAQKTSKIPRPRVIELPAAA